MRSIQLDSKKVAAAVVMGVLVCAGAPGRIQAQAHHQFKSTEAQTWQGRWAQAWLAHNMAGAFLVEVEFQNPPLGIFRELLLLSRDGGLVREGFANPPGQDWSAGIGAWTPDPGRGRRARFRFLGFAASEQGILEATHRITATMQFSPDFQTFAGTGTVHFLLPQEDPLDPDAPPLQSFTVAISGRRIQP